MPVFQIATMKKHSPRQPKVKKQKTKKATAQSASTPRPPPKSKKDKSADEMLGELVDKLDRERLHFVSSRTVSLIIHSGPSQGGASMGKRKVITPKSLSKDMITASGACTYLYS